MTVHQLAGASDAELKDALEGANFPTLLLTLCQMSGDMSFLEGPNLPSKSLDGVRHMPAAFQESLKQQAFDIIRDIRDGRRKIADMPDPETLQRMLSIYIGEPVGDEYVPMFLEDMGFINSLDAHINWTCPPAKSALAQNHVVIIGAGLSGISAGIHLKKAGIPFTIYEKNDSIGGTWYENTYPACGVDTPNHFYSFSFEPNADWSGYYSKRDEIFGYIKQVAEKHGILEHVHFKHHMKDATYNAKTCAWDIQIEGPDGAAIALSPKYLISAVGQLNRPKVPNFRGLETFEGPAFHSAHWRHDVSLADKKVVVVGTGASAMQLCPEVAKDAAHLTILQRTPHWIRVLPDYHRRVSDAKKWLLKHIPFYQNWYRFRLFWSYGDGIWESLHMDPNWPEPAQSLNAENGRHRQMFIQNLSDAVKARADLLEKIVPDYPPFAKRMLIDNHWCDMLQEENVELATAGVREITPKGIIDQKGDFHEADVIVFATGFDAGNLLGSLDIHGRSGMSIHDQWGEDPRAYMGMTTPDFPNFFMFYGPNTNLAHGGSLIFHIECQSRYITRALMRMIEKGYREIEVRPDVHATYNAKVDAEHGSMVWTHPGVNNWYQNSKGRVVTNSPWRLVDYWTMTRNTDLKDYKIS